MDVLYLIMFSASKQKDLASGYYPVLLQTTILHFKNSQRPTKNVNRSTKRSRSVKECTSLILKLSYKYISIYMTIPDSSYSCEFQSYSTGIQQDDQIPVGMFGALISTGKLGIKDQKRLLWSDKTKINYIGSDRKVYI